MFGNNSEKLEDNIGTIDVIDELVSYAWNIDWSLCQKKRCGEFIQSPSFSTLTDDGKILEWKMQLYPDGVNHKCRGNMSLYLRTVQNEKRGFQQKVVYFHLLNYQGEEINRVYGELFLQYKRDTCGLDRFIRKDLLEKTISEVLNFGKLTVVCTIADIRTERKICSSKQPKLPLTPKPLAHNKSLGDPTRVDSDEEEEKEAKESPGNQFEAMLESGKSDVIIVAGDRSFCAHRAILSERSSFFKRIFEQDIAQRKRVSFVDMNKFTVDVIIELMRYMYLKRVDKLEERASVLLGPSNKCELEELKNQCEEIMIKSMNVSNACEYLVLSFLHEASKLQEKAMDFVVSHSLDVVNSPGFRSIAGAHANIIAAILKSIIIDGKTKEEAEESVWMWKKNHKCQGKLCKSRLKLWEKCD